MKLTLPVAGLALLATVGPVQAQNYMFDVCGAAAMTASFKVCASAEVFMSGSGSEMHIRVWNRNQTPNSVNPTVASEYSSTWGGWHTITSIGVSNIAYNPVTGPFLSEARHYHAGGALTDGDGNTYDILLAWGADADAQSLQIYNTGADVNNGHKEGIVGCFDPGPASANHISTCSNFPVAPYVEFVISGFTMVDLSTAVFEFHSQQVATAKCTYPSGFNNQCTEDSAKGSGPYTPPPPPPAVPEPFTMILLGTGLAGVGAVRRRRRGEAAGL